MINIGICDDRKEIINKYLDIFDHIADEEGLVLNIMSFISGEQLLFDVNENVNEFDILYMDIEMGGINGIEAAKKMRDKGSKSIIIFLTDNEQYVFKSFDVTPFQYILKSKITYKNFKEILMKAIQEKRNKESELFVYESQNIKKLIPLNDISYFDIQNRVVTIHCLKENLSFYSKLEEVSDKLHNTWFVRVHRSFIVNLHFVDRITSKYIVMMNQEEIPIGTTYQKKVKELFSEFLLSVA